MNDLLNALVLLSNYVLIPSLSYGSQLALGALGVTLVFGILRFANFAHGEMMSFATMGTIFITWWLQSLGIADRGFVLVTGENRYTDSGQALLDNDDVRRSFLGG